MNSKSRELKALVNRYIILLRNSSETAHTQKQWQTSIDKIVSDMYKLVAMPGALFLKKYLDALVIAYDFESNLDVHVTLLTGEKSYESLEK